MKLWKPIRLGRPGQPDYLWRVNLLRLFGYSVKLHRFLQSDLDECLHDHPWPFATLILSGGYYEVAEDGVTRLSRTWHGPGSFLVRPARFRHRIIVPAYPCGECAFCLRSIRKRGGAIPQRHPETESRCFAPRRVAPWTLFFAGKKCRPWGFWTTRGFVNHKDFEGC